jgi:alpha-beta hydrolase superfamily lysophospholipase
MIRPLSIPADGLTLDGAAYFPDEPSRAVVVICHGLPRGVPVPDVNDPGYPGVAERFAQAGYTTVIFNFRGTGKSGGSLEIDRWPDDLKAVLTYLDGTDELARPNYAVVAFSAGGAAAICAGAGDKRIDPLMTIAAPADFQFLAELHETGAAFQHYRSLGMIAEDYPGDANSWSAGFSKLEALKCADLLCAGRLHIIHGDADDTVPVNHAYQLAEKARGQVRLTILEDLGHQLRQEEKGIETILAGLADWFGESK